MVPAGDELLIAPTPARRRYDGFALVAGLAVAAIVTVLVTGALAGAGPRPAENSAPAKSVPGKLDRARAIFAGGCFWCMEPAFDRVDGVLSTTSGYVGGHKDDPTYAEVSAGTTGHAESVEVVFDPARVTYEKLLDVFWHNVDPLAAGRQFCDVGEQYRSAIFYLDEAQQRAAEASRAALDKSGRLHGRIATEILPAGRFWPAEDYHQDYYRKNPVRYHYYRWGCGRDARLREVWGDAAPH